MATACKNTPLSLVDYPILLQDFTFVNILKYTDVLNKAHKCENNYNFVMTKGRELYSSRFVTDVKFTESEKKWTIEARVKAEMKKTTVYKTSTTISKDGEVSKIYHFIIFNWINIVIIVRVCGTSIFKAGLFDTHHLRKNLPLDKQNRGTSFGSMYVTPFFYLFRLYLTIYY